MLDVKTTKKRKWIGSLLGAALTSLGILAAVISIGAVAFFLLYNPFAWALAGALMLVTTISIFVLGMTLLLLGVSTGIAAFIVTFNRKIDGDRHLKNILAYTLSITGLILGSTAIGLGIFFLVSNPFGLIVPASIIGFGLLMLAIIPVASVINPQKSVKEKKEPLPEVIIPEQNANEKGNIERALQEATENLPLREGTLNIVSIFAPENSNPSTQTSSNPGVQSPLTPTDPKTDPVGSNKKNDLDSVTPIAKKIGKDENDCTTPKPSAEEKKVTRTTPRTNRKRSSSCPLPGHDPSVKQPPQQIQPITTPTDSSDSEENTESLLYSSGPSSTCSDEDSDSSIFEFKEEKTPSITQEDSKNISEGDTSTSDYDSSSESDETPQIRKRRLSFLGTLSPAKPVIAHGDSAKTDESTEDGFQVSGYSDYEK